MQVHRCRFIDWVPDEVDSLSFSPDGTQLAVGRKAGTIELYVQVPTNQSGRTSHKWYRYAEIPSEAEGSSHSLAWASPTRLIAGTLGGTITEWDLTTLTAVQTLPSNGGAVWCISVSPDRRTLAAACEDGAVRLYDLVDATSDDDATPCLEPRATLARRKERLLCVCWSPDGRGVYAGGASGVIAGWDAASGRATLSATLDALAGGSTVVWSIACAGPDVIVTGDSLGRTVLWDRGTGTLLASFKEHQSDVLAVAADPSGSAVFASGVDNKLCLFQRVESEGSRWVCRGGIRRHTHDVRALAVSPQYIASAGVDTQIAVFTLESFAAGKVECLISPLPPLPHAHVAVAQGARLLLARFRRSLQLWRLGTPSDSPASSVAVMGGTVPLGEQHAHLFDFDLSKGTASSLTCSSISHNGRFIACSDSKALRVYALNVENGNNSAKVGLERLRPRNDKTKTGSKKKSLLDVTVRGAYTVAFTPDERHVIAAALDKPEISIYALGNIDSDGGSNEKSLTLVRTIAWGNDDGNDVSSNTSGSGLPKLAFSLAVSPDSGVVAVATMENMIRLFSIEKGNCVGVVPPLSGRFTAAAFATAGTLVLTTTDARYYVWDVAAASLTGFSRVLNSAAERVLPAGEVPAGVAVDPADGKNVCVYGKSWMARVPLGSDGEESGKSGEELVAMMAKRVIPVRKYNMIMEVGFVGNNELAVVERPWVHVLQKLPEPFNYSRFAT